MSSTSSSSSSSDRGRQSILQWMPPAEPHGPSLKKLAIGKRHFMVGFNHWAIKIGDFWFEIGGESKTAAAEQQQIFVHSTDRDYETITHMQQQAWVSDAAIKEWCVRWLQEHPHYRVNGDNCQMFAKDAMDHFADLALVTENKSVGDQITFGSIIVGIATIIGGYIAGKIIKGSH